MSASDSRPALSTLHVWRNDVIDWVIASGPADADAVWLEHTGGYPPDDPHEWKMVPDDRLLPINDDDRGHVEKTCAAWIIEHGRGFLASTEY